MCLQWFDYTMCLQWFDYTMFLKWFDYTMFLKWFDCTMFLKWFDCTTFLKWFDYTMFLKLFDYTMFLKWFDYTMFLKWFDYTMFLKWFDYTMFLKWFDYTMFFKWFDYTMFLKWFDYTMFLKWFDYTMFLKWFDYTMFLQWFDYNMWLLYWNKNIHAPHHNQPTSDVQEGNVHFRRRSELGISRSPTFRSEKNLVKSIFKAMKIGVLTAFLITWRIIPVSVVNHVIAFVFKTWGWKPLPNGHSWIINGGGSNYALTGMILQVEQGGWQYYGWVDSEIYSIHPTLLHLSSFVTMCFMNCMFNNNM